MKSKLFLLLLGTHFCVFSQIKTAPTVNFQPASIEKTECITDAQRADVRNQIAINKAKILQNNPSAFQHKGASPLFILPLRHKAGFNDYGYYTINNQVDHDLAPNGHLLDYECGQRTYDWINGNHEGTDYVLWPYPWKRMQEEVMEVIAAAPGIIIDKRDGNFDLNCENNGNPLWNGIIVEHADGSQAWYWHFKDGAITSKNIGDAVAEGEYLGAAGSSGSSTIPHLHFEVYDSENNLIDPYEGPCNSMNLTSWFADQPDYYIPVINHLSTHYTSDFDDECGVVENTYEELNFEPGETVYFRIFYRDIRMNDETHIVVRKPDNSILYDYVFTSPWETYTAAYAEWQYPTDSSWEDGVYNISAEFGGNSYQTIFGINTNLGVEDLKAFEVSLYPNPTSGKISIEANSQIEKVTVFDLLGRNVLEENPSSNETEIDLSQVDSGIYVAVVASGNSKTVKRIVRE